MAKVNKKNLFKKILIASLVIIFFLPQKTTAENSALDTNLIGEQSMLAIGSCVCTKMFIGGGYSNGELEPYTLETLDKPIEFKNMNQTQCLADFTEYGGYQYSGCTFMPEVISTESLSESLELNEPILEINWPGLNFTDAKDVIYQNYNGKRYIILPWLSEFIIAVYKFLIAISSIVAVVMIIVEGVKIIVSGVSGIDKSTGFKNIGRIAIGLAIAWTSFFILNQINPELVNLKILKVDWIDEIDIPPDYDLPEKTSTGGTVEVGDVNVEGWIEFPNDIGNVIGKENKFARADLIAALSEAVKEYYGKYGGNLYLNDAGRTPLAQYKLMIDNCKCPAISQLKNRSYDASDWQQLCSVLKSGQTCKAGWKNIKYTNGQFQGPRIGHVAGNAVDITAGTGASTVPCKNLSDEKERESDGVTNSNNKSKGYCIPKEQQELIGIMIKHGFCVGLNSKSTLREAWHFEYKNNNLGVSFFCTDNINDPNLQKLKYLNGE